MQHHVEPLWITPDAASSSTGGCCGTCGGGQDTHRACDDDTALPRCEQPQLDGPQELVQRALARLNEVIDPGSHTGLVDARLIGALSIGDGEVELALSFPMHCGSAVDLADEAFHALRAALPDTDIFVRHGN